jgi:hypothetical protein
MLYSSLEMFLALPRLEMRERMMELEADML